VSKPLAISVFWVRSGYPTVPAFLDILSRLFTVPQFEHGCFRVKNFERESCPSLGDLDAVSQDFHECLTASPLP
jgi:hypothetical protein